MKHIYITFVPVLLVCCVIGGCELVTESTPQPQFRPANHVVINEVFTLPLTNQFTHSWVEFYNPTQSPVRVTFWTMSFATRQTLFVQDTAGTFRDFRVTDGQFDVPLSPRHSSLVIPANGFLTIVNNEDRLLSFTEYGNGDGPIVVGGTTIQLPPDTVRLDSIRNVSYVFQFQMSDQFVLKDSSGTIVDVFRYGNYTYTGPVTDPLLGPSNVTKGVLPQWQSYARYAGAYFTGNSSTDFYITGTEVAQTRPIPHYFSTGIRY
jgi:hypothetical protein